MKNLNLIFAWVCLLFISTACNDVEPSISSLPVPTSKPYSINREGYKGGETMRVNVRSV